MQHFITSNQLVGLVNTGMPAAKAAPAVTLQIRFTLKKPYPMRDTPASHTTQIYRACVCSGMDTK